MPLRRAAPEALPTAPPLPRAPEDLLALLRSDDDDALRRDAAYQLGKMPHAAAALGECLAGETAASVREAILSSLISIASPEAAHAVAGFLANEDVALRNGAIDALRQMGDPAVAETALLLQSTDTDVRILAVNVLEELHHPETVRHLRAILESDPDVNVGVAAVDALARHGEPGDAARLRAFAARFSAEPFVQFAVDWACQRVTTGPPPTGAPPGIPSSAT